MTLLCILMCLIDGRPRTLKKCGKKDSPFARIIGGKGVQPGEYPWMVSIHEQYYGFNHICGGAILNEYYIITAAHCIDYPKKPSKYEIYAGMHKLSKKTRMPTQKYKIAKIIVHEDYDKETFANDIALLRTKEPIKIAGTHGNVNGVCLPYTDRDPTGLAVVTGWGHTEEDGENSDVLQAVKVPLVPRDLCFEAYDEDPDDESDDVLETQICAGIAKRDSCQNDSGGPLVQKNKKGVYTLIGIVSYGAGCGHRDYPGIYTKVASYMDWLEENMY